MIYHHSNQSYGMEEQSCGSGRNGNGIERHTGLLEMDVFDWKQDIQGRLGFS